MRIGYYKLNTLLSDALTKEDKNGMYKEFLLLYRLLKDNSAIIKDEVVLLDKINLKSNDYYDAIFVLNGIITDNVIEEIINIKKHTNKMFYILTDLRLVPPENIINLFEIIYAMTIFPITKTQMQCYSKMQELPLYGANIETINYFYDNFDKKQKLFIFGGGFKNRKEKIIDYILNNNFEYYGKGELNGKFFDNRVSINEYYDLLGKTKYSIAIADKENNETGFVTWRYYENILKGVITFIDFEYDKFDLIELDKEAKEFLRVKNGNELIKKINILESNADLRQNILYAQRKLITINKINGRNIYNQLMNWRN